MGDDEHTLERVGRAHTPAMWIGGWVLGLVAVVGLAVAGRGAPADGVVGTPGSSLPPFAAAPIPATPAATSTPTLPDGLPRVLRPFGVRPSSSPRPQPTLGDDGLVGGQVYSSARPGG